MANATDTQNPQQGKQEQEESPKFKPGELTPWWYSPEPAAKLSSQAERSLMRLADIAGNKDVAARRWEVEQSWEARLFDRGYHYLLPRKGGGWILPPFATDYNRTSTKRGGMKFYGYETNVYTTYGEIITAALTRDVPRVRFDPYDPASDADITAAEAATRYGRIFSRQNDLLDFQQQIAYFLRNDGRALICVDHVLDAQRFGRQPMASEPAVVPETEGREDQAQAYIVRHGETADNQAGVMRGRRPTPLDGEGRTESDQAADYLKDKGITVVVCSPVPRAYETGQRIAQKLGVSVEADDRIASLDVGSMAGQSSSENGDNLQEAFENPDEPVAGDGEAPAEFDERTREFFFDLIRQGVKAAVVTHDSVISSLARQVQDSAVKADMVPPGGVLGLYALEGENYVLRPVFPNVNAPGETPGEQSIPRGAEILWCGGKLEHKVPMNTRSLQDCPYVQIAEEFDIAYVKAMVSQIAPEKVNRVKPGGGTAGENELDRIARINVALALEASYVTGDSMVRDCTVQRLWFRPSFFFELSEEEGREELLETFPKGCFMLICGDEFICARNESMDDHLTLLHAFPGSGQNRISLLAKVLSIQKRLNNWVDLLNDYFIRTIPQRYVNSQAIDVEALNEQPSVPGAYIPVDHDTLQGIQGGLPGTIWVEPTPTHQPSMPEFVKMFANDLPQLLSGALPSLFGAESNTDTVGGIAMQRDQALGRLGTPWHSMQMATANYFRQAVMIAARSRRTPISARAAEGEVIRIELTELKGDVLAYPESNANFPESWVQKQDRYQRLLMDVNNPLVAQILASPGNLKLARDMVGIQEFEIKQADSYEKQLGELDFLLKTGPVPNAKKEMLVQQAQQAMAEEQDPDQQQQLGTAVEQAQSMPDMVSSLEVDPDTDDHAVEMQACLDWINRPEGRKFRNGTEQQKQGFMNVRLHFLEHKQYADSLRAQNQQQKPPSTSINFRDLPPETGAAMLQKQGLPGSPGQIAQTRVAASAVKRLSKEPPKLQ